MGEASRELSGTHVMKELGATEVLSEKGTRSHGLKMTPEPTCRTDLEYVGRRQRRRLEGSPERLDANMSRRSHSTESHRFSGLEHYTSECRAE